MNSNDNSSNLLGNKREDTTNKTSEEKPKTLSGGLFGNIENKGGLFGNISGTNLNDKKPSLFGEGFSSSFGSFGNTGIFSNKSLFSSDNAELYKGTSSLFSTLKSSDSFKKTDEEDDEEGKEAEEYYRKEGEKIVGYKPENVPPSDYDKLFVKQVENLFAFNKEEKKFISRGKGFLSIEKHKTNLNHTLSFRNAMGNIILEGLFTKGIKKSEKSSEGVKNVATFCIIEVSKDKKTSSVICKVPVSQFINQFSSLELLNEFTKLFDEITEEVNNTKDDKNDNKDKDKDKTDKEDKEKESKNEEIKLKE